MIIVNELGHNKVGVCLWGRVYNGVKPDSGDDLTSQCAAKVWSVLSEGGGTETYGPMRPKRNETKRNGTKRNETERETKATP